ncbi:hypothetical protein [Aquimarina brevivitae]|uniref:Uncharacterized protein n=1 Tax=Aquimarina brevivitae TaxID=323412 RepID=A0A4Q7NUX9_9FLAO|nr:hypothetical protein [Aquimarina brevivitae]RZS90750.1 hypothetical protein EV197_3281 [Aquimarina brevivitae]
MKLVEPYQSVDEAMKELDNGGRFYNLWTKADDGVISSAELAKVAGIFSDKQKMVLYLQMAMCKLSADQKTSIIANLEDSLKQSFGDHKVEAILNCLPTTAMELGKNVMIKGTPKQIESKSDFNGFIMVPIMTGSVTTFSMIPIIDQYEVYEIRSETDEKFTLAHAKGAHLPEEELIVGGVIKELKASKNDDEAAKFFVEAVYYAKAK